jgi:hypothetical protein
MLILLAVLQAAAPQAAQGPSPVARIVVEPAGRTVTAGDTVRLRATAFDSAGAAIADARIYFFAAPSSRFEGRVDTTGLLRAGSPGTLPMTVRALVPGAAARTEQFELQIVAGPATRIAAAPGRLRLAVGQSVPVEAVGYSKAGDRRRSEARWSSSRVKVASVTAEGVVTGVAAGQATVAVRMDGAQQEIPVEVVGTPIAGIEVTGASDARQGDVVRFTAVAHDRQGRPIEGLMPVWSLSGGAGMIDQDGAFVGYEAGRYTVTATIGPRAGSTTIGLSWRDVRRPATVVGRLGRSLFSTEEVWVHPNGKVAYLGTGSGGDRMYAIDISDPAHPVVTDSLVANTRRVNDIMTTPDGKYLVHTREGASDRKNGIVIASLEDPRHPKVLAEYTEDVTGGVHSAFVYRQEKYGTHIYLTNDGTGYLHVIDINEPSHPREVARWSTRPDQMGNALHDVDVQDGLAYLSYWNEGLVILDVGNGLRGGSPDNPQLVSQFKYDLNEFYRDVEATGGPGFIRGTHTAWRHGKYVFVADEVFPASGVQGAADAAVSRAYGRLHVVDVSDITAPHTVAWYEPEFGGVHNVWAAGDTLYMGAYNAGFRAFDISGELRGDLRAQGREMVHVNTADMDGYVKNSAMTWGVVVRDGLAYVNDDNNGLWIVRIEPKIRPLTP